MSARLLAAAAVSLAALGTAQAVTVTSITGTGTFFNSPASLLTDGDFALGTWWTDAPNVYWQDQELSSGVVLTLTLDRLYTLKDVSIGLDNNDFYAFQVSTNGSTWNNLFTSMPTSLDAGYVYSGQTMIQRSSALGDPGYSSLIDFSDVQARYVRIFAIGGDHDYAVSEVQLTGTAVPVPEPETAAMLLAGLTALGFLARRRTG